MEQKSRPKGVMHNKKSRVSEMKLDFFCLFSAEDGWGDATAALEEFAEG